MTVPAGWPGSSTPLDEMTGLTPLLATTRCPEPRHVFQKLWDEYGPVAPVELEPGLNAWLVMGYHELLTVARQEQTFSCDPTDWSAHRNGTLAPDSLVGPRMSPTTNAYHSNGERHRRLRAPIDGGLARIDQRRMRRAVAALCAEVIAGFAGRSEADLITDYAAVVPVLAIADTFGLEPAKGRGLYAAMRELFTWGADSEAAAGRLMAIIGEVVAARRMVPTDDLTSFLVTHPDLDGDTEIYDNILLVIVAANENSVTWIGQTLRLMLTDERFAGRLRGGRLGVDDALDEVLWRDSPYTNAPGRYALRDIELGGQTIRRGDALILGLTAANADPRIHVGTDAWLEVGNRAHLSWGAGPHACPAQVPARLIARTAVERALHLLPGVRLAVPPGELPLASSPWSRGPASLPVRLPPSAQTATGQP